MSIETLIQHYGALALFLGAGLEGETVVVAGGLLAHKGLVPLWVAMAASSVGSFTADQLFFTAGRHFRDHPRVRRIAARPAFAKALGALERYPTAFIFAFRFLYGLRTVSPIAIGTTQVPTRRFLIVNAIAAIVWGVLFTSIGYVFGRGFERLIDRFIPNRQTLLIVGGVVAVLVVAGVGIHWWRTRTRAPVPTDTAVNEPS